jgi:hypothetical protein
MKVHDRNLTGAAAPETGRAGEAQRTDRFTSSAGSSAAAGSGGDRVEFSSSLGRLTASLDGFNAARSSKVQALADQYQKGAYRVDAMATSRAMIGEALASRMQ